MIDIGSRRELFVDTHVMENLERGATLRLHHPVPREVSIVHDRPWEGNTCAYNTIFRDGDLYRMYYRGSNHSTKNAAAKLRDTHPQFTCYAESDDGIHWTRPDLRLVDFDGSKDNNILLEGEGTHNLTPFKDTNPDCAEDARYKAVGSVGGKRLGAFQSADGIHWQAVGDESLTVSGYFDSQNLVFWDSERSEYRMYYRDFRRAGPREGGLRDIKTATSKNFVDWSEGVWLDYPDAPSEQLYTNQVLPYYRAPHIFLGFPARFLADRDSMVEPLLMSSRDGRVFHRWEEAFIRPGRNPGRWQDRSNYVWWGIVETASDQPGGSMELSLYTNECMKLEGRPSTTRRFTCRIDGFVSLNAPFVGGEMLTRPLKFSGNRLILNVATSAAGSVRVELRTTDGNPIEGYSAEDCEAIYGDDIKRVVSWKPGPDLGALQHRPVRLRFILRDADVFAFRFAEHGQEQEDRTQ